jgi:hypothetical protein
MRPSSNGIGEPEVADCPMCGTHFERTLVRFDFRGHFFGYFPADVCARGHDFLTDESSVAIEKVAKALGLFGPRKAPRKSRAPSRAG